MTWIVWQRVKCVMHTSLKNEVVADFCPFAFRFLYAIKYRTESVRMFLEWTKLLTNVSQVVESVKKVSRDQLVGELLQIKVQASAAGCMPING
jgi:hypothetical protein